MNVVYTEHEPVIKGRQIAVFLIGPTPRKPEVPSWRPKALQVLRLKGFEGTVFIPECSKGGFGNTYNGQVEWERAALTNPDTVYCAWVPRCMETMPALTTNVEFGYFIAKHPDKFFYGRPEGAASTRYLDWLYNVETGRVACNSLDSLIDKVMFYTDNH